jgi:hypothetical protein
MSFPPKFIRGIRSRDHFHEDGLVGPPAFSFEKNPKRSDTFHEASINWEDDPLVADFTMSLRKGDTDEFEFKAGIATFSLERLHAILPDFLAKGEVSYERRQLDDNSNPYHGNLLLSDAVDGKTKKLIIAGICLAVVSSRRR